MRAIKIDDGQLQVAIKWCGFDVVPIHDGRDHQRFRGREFDRYQVPFASRRPTGGELRRPYRFATNRLKAATNVAVLKVITTKACSIWASGLFIWVNGQTRHLVAGLWQKISEVRPPTGTMFMVGELRAGEFCSPLGELRGQRPYCEVSGERPASVRLAAVSASNASWDVIPRLRIMLSQP
jgi:hypothetical protein